MVDIVKPPVNSETMYKDSGSNPAVMCANLTPNDSTDLDPHARALRVGGAGNVTIQNTRGESVLFSNVQAGETLPCTVKRLMVTGTTATNIVAWYG